MTWNTKDALWERPPSSREKALTYLDNVENHILVEAVQYALGHPVVAPGTVNQQELL